MTVGMSVLTCPTGAVAAGAAVYPPGYPHKSKMSPPKKMSPFSDESQQRELCVQLTLSGWFIRHRGDLRRRLVKVGGPESQSPSQEAAKPSAIPRYTLLQER